MPVWAVTTQVALLAEGGTPSEESHTEMQINYTSVLKAVWLMCLVEALVFIMTFAYVTAGTL